MRGTIVRRMWPFSLFRRRRQVHADGAPCAEAAAPAQGADADDGPLDFDPDAPVELPIDGELDLHHFAPRDVRSLVPEYLQACQSRGILAVRIVHGKGRGHLRRSVHALLERSPLVLRFGLAPPERGGWGATLVDLRPP